MYFRKAEQADYNAILTIWEESVLSTHDFLRDKDREEIKREIPNYLPYLNLQLWYEKDELIGFSGINDHHLEMLFLNPYKIGKGYGRTIIGSLIKDFNIKTVDVNKDNENATNFYNRNGFHVISQSELDSSGRPYPILHLELK